MKMFENNETEGVQEFQRELGKLQDQKDSYIQIREIIQQIEELEELKEDEEFRLLSEQEIKEKEEQLEQVKSLAIQNLVPNEHEDVKGAIMEFRAGTGGAEGSLFAENLMNAYIKYAYTKNWQSQVLEISKDTQINKGCKEGILKIQGHLAYSDLLYEAGVHKVIRVPETEKIGRLHSSTAQILVLPLSAPLNFEIHEKDIKVDTFRSSGAGGQHVNKTDSAVRVTHIPTGIVATNQDGRSQHQNKQIAMEVLYARVYDYYIQLQEEQKSKYRSDQRVRGDRSEKIRTYNYPQSRITDHRFNFTLYGVEDMMQGLLIDQFIERAKQERHQMIITELLG